MAEHFGGRCRSSVVEHSLGKGVCKFNPYRQHQQLRFVAALPRDHLRSTAPRRAAKTTLVAARSSDTPFKKPTPRLVCNLFSSAVFCQGPTLSLNRTLTETLPTRMERMRLASLRPAMAARHDAT